MPSKLENRVARITLLLKLLLGAARTLVNPRPEGTIGTVKQPRPQPPRLRLWLILLLGIPLAIPALGQDGEATHLGAWLHTISDLRGPVALDYTEGGALWVVEADGNRLSLFGPSGKPSRQLESSGPWLNPRGVAVDTRLYVSDPAYRRVLGIAVEAWHEADTVVQGPSGLCEPGALDAKDGRLVIADPLGGRVVLFQGSKRLELGVGLLGEPTGVCLDDEGGTWVSDAARARVEHFDPDGNHVGGFGDYGAFRGLLAAPSGIAWWNHRVFVADRDNHRISVHTEGGDLLYTVGLHALRPREGKGLLHYPSAIAVSADGTRLAVAEPLDGRVQVFSRAMGAEPTVDPLRRVTPQASAHYGPAIRASGQWMLLVEPETHSVLLHDTRRDEAPIELTSFGRRGSALGRWIQPEGIWLDLEERTAWVSDPTAGILDQVLLRIDPQAPLNQHLGAAAWVRRVNLRALKRDLGGVSVFHDPRPTAICRREGKTYVIDRANRCVLVIDETQTCVKVLGAGVLLKPIDLCFDPKGILWISDAWQGRILGFDPNSGESRGSRGAGALQSPDGICCDQEGRIFVSDRAANRVLRFSSLGAVDLSIGKEGLGPEGLLGPRGLSIGKDGNISVVDHGNHRCMVFTTEGEFVRAFGSKLHVRPAMQPKIYDEWGNKR